MVIGKDDTLTTQIVDDYLKAEKNKNKEPAHQLKEVFDILMESRKYRFKLQNQKSL
jgi:hypothetical protein